MRAAGTLPPPARLALLRRLAERLAALTGWRRYALAALFGVLATLSLPPVYALPLIVPAMSGLLWLHDGSRTRWQTLALGWWFGFGFFLSGLYWIGISMTIDLARFGWMIPFATGGLSAGFAFYSAAALLLLELSRAKGVGRVFAFAAAWTACEWLRGHLFTGFPWNLVAYSWTLADAPIQLASVVGAYGLSLVTVVIATLPAAAAGAHAARHPLRPIAAAALLAAALWAGGAVRLADASTALVPNVTLRLVQPDIAQRDKWDPARVRDNLLELMRLSLAPGYDRISDLVWPEAAVPFYLANEEAVRRELARLVPKDGLLLTGTLRRAPIEATATTIGGGYDAYNSLEALDGAGQIVASYDKFHLVPFGEYIPLRGILPIDKLTPGRGDFSSGPGPRTLALPHLPPVSPLICYEAIFPGDVADPARRPRWLLNVTNDAWFGDSSGPYQHFESARLRAVEEGLPLVRVANTGISGVVDPYGRVTARLGLGAKGILDVQLPAALAGATPMVRFGPFPLGVLLLAALLAAWRFSRP
ncbi:MAG TPA: apolipoprotein N-acyltransferase [Alphaproteobacteria bacterium]|nr:apolipoprotein N-acyltransferase [Alphaproteobacteria bacterium]